VFRGNAPARIDDKGRLKVPNAFRSLLESKYGRELFLTSLSRLRVLERVNYFGQAGDLDAQGRVIIPLRLREAATMAGDVDVLGQVTCLDVWNHDRFIAKMLRDPYTDDDARSLSEFGV
jgi:MraZ protein